MGSEQTIEVNGLQVTVHTFEAIIIGSGAAGLNCAHILGENDIDDIAIVTSGLGTGTSANSGSDKQTYYKMSVFGDAADSPVQFAETLTAGGMCHGDIAYVEALGSLPAFFNLVGNGVEFPHNRYGAYVGYRTDYDPRQRATSAGPRTSMQMVETTLQELRENETPIFDGYEVTRLLTEGAVRDGDGGNDSETFANRWDGSSGRRVIGAVALDRSSLDTEGHGVTVFLADYIVLATGGPGELYEASVYPRGQVGSHGLALEVGCRANNLTESQFGIASTDFRWNLSGTYQQVIPAYFSTDRDGGERRFFLNRYFQSMPQKAGNIFLKGYQWPFDAEKLQDYGSSIVDLAIYNERQAGRRVFMDFTRNPVAAEGMEEFAIDRLPDEAAEYLNRSGALQEIPYDRLQHTNPLAIEIYNDNGVGLRQPLEVDVCAQHCNGGLTVDRWWRTNVPGLFAIGEVAGTHGLRPGGSALNSGQVAGRRVATLIAHKLKSGGDGSDNGDVKLPGQHRQEAENGAAEELERVEDYMDAGADCPDTDEVRGQIQRRMTNSAGFIRSHERAERALREARLQAKEIRAGKQHIERPADLLRAIQNEYLAMTGVAFLTAVREFIEMGGGSRGSYMILDDDGELVVETQQGRGMPHRGENMDMRQQILEVVMGPNGRFETFSTPVRPIPSDDNWFENTWRAWRDGAVYD